MYVVWCTVSYYSVPYVKKELLILKYNETYVNGYVVEHRVSILFCFGYTPVQNKNGKKHWV